MFYTIYKITNKLDGKIYIGKHQTKNVVDDYMGSGKYLKRAQERHGIENFEKEILNIFDTEIEMNDKEAALVTEEFCSRDDTYNICPGGNGGFGFINQNKLSGYYANPEAFQKSSLKDGRNMVGITTHNKRIQTDPEYKEQWRQTILGRPPTFKGRTHSDETKKAIGDANAVHQSGSGNSQYGSMWITNGTKNKKIKKIDVIPRGWYKGRVKNNVPVAQW